MKTFVKRIIQKNNSFIKFDENHAENLTGDTNYKNTAEKIKSKNETINDLFPQLEDNEKVETAQKHEAKLNLVDACVPLADLAISYGEVTPFLPFSNFKKYNRSNLEGLAATKLISKITFFIQEIRENIETAALAGITTEKMDELENKINSYKELIDLPSIKRKELKEISETLNASCTEVNQLYRILKRYMRGAYQASNPDMYQDFINAISLDAEPHHQRDVKGKIYEIHSHKPLSKVKIYIDEQEPIIRGGQLGNYYIDHLDAGEHKLRFELEGFQDFTAEFVKIEGETYELDVEFQSVLEEEVI